MISIRFLATVLTYAIALCGILPLYPWLTVAPRVILAAALLGGILQDARGVWPVRPWLQNSIIAPAFIYYALQFSRSNPVEPVVSVLAIMLAARLSGEKTVRHCLQIHAIALFSLASTSLYDLSPTFLIYMALLLFLVAVTLVLLTFYNQDSDMCLSKSDLRKVLAAGLFMPLVSLPIMIFLFPLLPRTQMPLWNFLSSTPLLKSGLSGKVEPGSQSNIGESGALAFRAEMPRQSGQIYWRGTVFNQIEGNRWTRDRGVPAEEQIKKGRAVQQTIYPEPSDSKFLVALDRPSSITMKWIKRNPDGVYEYIGTSKKRVSYTAESIAEPDGNGAGSTDKSFYLRLPSDIPPRILKVGDDFRRSSNNDQSRLEKVETFFRNGGYRYSTRDLPTGDMALEIFLFDSKNGHCEFFAAAFATILRSAGVPCRLVGGYLGGDFNELGGYYLVTESMAHVWVEAFIEGSGWIRIDPSSFAENAGNFFSTRSRGTVMGRFQLLLDSINHSWNRTVIPYDFEHQMDFVRSTGKQLQRLDISAALRGGAAFAVAIVVITALYFASRQKLLSRSREERILNRFLQKLRQDQGVETGEGSAGLFEIADKTGNDKIRAFVDIYAGAVYRDRKLTDAEYNKLKQLLREGFVNREKPTEKPAETCG